MSDESDLMPKLTGEQLRELSEWCPNQVPFSFTIAEAAAEIIGLRDALEKAQGDMAAQMDSHDAWGELWTGKLDVAIAERDAARALLRVVMKWVPAAAGYNALRARLRAALEMSGGVK